VTNLWSNNCLAGGLFNLSLNENTWGTVTSGLQA
jgi:hypothetical protein